MFLNTDPLHKINEKSGVCESSIHDRLSAMDRVFYAYNDDDDQIPFELNDDVVGYYNDIDDDDEIKNYDDEFITISPLCHSVNIDGTPMLSCNFDIYGNPYGVTNTDMFEDTSSSDICEDTSCEMLEDTSIDMFEDTSCDMFDDDGMDCDMFSDDTF